MAIYQPTAHTLYLERAQRDAEFFLSCLTAGDTYATERQALVAAGVAPQMALTLYPPCFADSALGIIRYFDTSPANTLQKLDGHWWLNGPLKMRDHLHALLAADQISAYLAAAEESRPEVNGAAPSLQELLTALSPVRNDKQAFRAYWTIFDAWWFMTNHVTLAPKAQQLANKLMLWVADNVLPGCHTLATGEAIAKLAADPVGRSKRGGATWT